jgi:signal transduction histidine kinase
VFYIERQAEHLFENSAIQLHIALPTFIPHVQLEGEKRRQIYLAVKEALHNCIRHSGAQTCNLSFDLSNDFMQVSIIDNGKWTRQQSSTWGNGLKNMQKRIEQINGSMEIENTNGTSVNFTIPI